MLPSPAKTSLDHESADRVGGDRPHDGHVERDIPADRCATAPQAAPCLSKTRNIGCGLVKGTHADRRTGAIRSPLTTTLPPMNRRPLRLVRRICPPLPPSVVPTSGSRCRSASLPVAVARLGLQIFQNRPIYAASRMSQLRKSSSAASQFPKKNADSLSTNKLVKHRWVAGSRCGVCLREIVGCG